MSAAGSAHRALWFQRARGVVGAEAPAGLEAALASAIERARAVWPAPPSASAATASSPAPSPIQIADEEFVAHLAHRVPVGADPVAFAGSLNAPDLLLALGCARRDPVALGVFEARYLDNLGALVGGVTRDPTQLDELRQILREKLLVGSADGAPRIAGYSGRGALLSWVRMAANRAALDLVEARAAQPYEDITDAAERMGTGGDFELGFARARYRGEFERALRDAFAAVSVEQRNLLRLVFVDGLTIDELGALFKVHRATAARRVQSARDAVHDETRRLLRERLALEGTELDSLWRLLQSQLDISLSRVLPAAE